MNWKNFKLGTKLGIGFGLLIIITLILGGLAIYNMLRISDRTHILANEYVPEVAIANNIERNTFQTMYAIRRYNYTAEEDYYQAGVDYLKAVKRYLEDATELGKKSTVLVKLNKNINDIDQSISQYEGYMKQTQQINKDIKTNRDELDNAAIKFIDNVQKFLDSQNEELKAEIRGGAVPMIRQREIHLITEILTHGEEIRIANFKSQALLQTSIAEEGMFHFDEINTHTKELRGLITDQNNRNKLDKVEEAADTYKTAMSSLTNDMKELLKINEDRRDLGQEILQMAMDLSKAGIDGTNRLTDESVEVLNTSNIIMVVGLIIALLMGIIFAWVITRSITIPINKGVAFTRKFANGDLAASIDVNQKDEIGMLADALRQMAEKLAQIVSNIRTGADNIASASQQLSSTSQQLSQGSSEQASAAEEVSSSMEQMASNIQQNTDNSQQTEKIANKAADDILGGSKNVNTTVESMRTIAEKISIINEIAFQTNILALNAAVEAARAGEHGKGFAVVAAEVRKLAERSQKAAAEIDDLSKSSVDIAERSGKLLSEIVPDIQNTSKLVQEITAASIEQNSGADQVNNAVQQLNQVTQQNAAASEEMATSSQELASQADQLREIIAFFKLDENKVQSTIKSIQSNTAKKRPEPAKTNINTSQETEQTSQEPKKTIKDTGFKLDMGDTSGMDNDFETF